jgi:RNA polymerase sigma-70 factor (ECF subfamily)
MNGVEERALIAGAMDGDRASQEGLVRLYERRVFGLIVRMVGNREDARDILQETMVKALTSLHMYDASYSFTSWIFRIASNKSLDFLRRQKIELRIFAHDEEDRTDLFRDKATPMDEVIARKLDWDIFEGCMEKLDPRYRAALFLRYKDGLSYKEIGRVLTVPVGTVKTLLHRGRGELRELVREKFEGGSSS